jgi:transposase
MHIKPLPREKCAIIKLTNLGYSINQLSDAFGRSTSFVHKCVRNSINVGIAHFVSKRKMPSQIRLACAANRRRMLQKWISLWEAFILGEVDKPP